MYQRGERNLYGHSFPDNLVKNEKLKATIITPTTKALQGEHDAPITAKEIIETNLLDKKIWDEVSKKALALFDIGKKIASKNGLILVDTKYEFGVNDENQVTLADEIHTPDSSRYWIKHSYDSQMQNGKEPISLDKEFLRLWITSQCDPYKEPIPEIPQKTLIDFSEKYIQVFEQITGEKFKKPPINESVQERVHTRLKQTFPEYFE